MKMVGKRKAKRRDEGTHPKFIVTRYLIAGGVLAVALLAGCAPGEETVETDTLITRAEVYNELGERVSYSDFSYDGRGLLVTESHHAGERLTKVSFEHDEKERLKTRIDEAAGQPPIRLDYAYADDGTITVRQSSEGQPVLEMNDVYVNGVLVERNWGESRPNVLVFRLETASDKIVRRTYLTGGALRSTETLTFADGRLTALEYRSRDKNETRRFAYDGKKLITESVFDDSDIKTSEIKYSYSPVRVLKSRAGTYNYLHVANLLAEVKGSRAE